MQVKGDEEKSLKVGEDSISDFIESSEGSSESEDHQQKLVQDQLNEIEQSHSKTADDKMGDKKLSLKLPKIEGIDISSRAEGLNRVHYKRPRDGLTQLRHMSTMITGTVNMSRTTPGSKSKGDKNALSDFHKNMLALNKKIEKEKELKLRRKSLKKSESNRSSKKYSHSLQIIKEERDSNMGAFSKMNSSSRCGQDSDCSSESKKKAFKVRQCQSDIVNEDDFGHWEGGSAWEGLSEDKERDYNSDIHEMFFVNEIFKNDNRFDKLMRKLERGYSTSSASSLSHRSDASGADSSSSSSMRSHSSFERSRTSQIGGRRIKKQHDDEGSSYGDEEHDEEGMEEEEEEVYDEEIDDEYGDEDEEEEVLTMDRVRFNSLCILPSQIECCSLDYQEKQVASGK